LTIHHSHDTITTQVPRLVEEDPDQTDNNFISAEHSPLPWNLAGHEPQFFLTPQHP
jgi:hypothetical protein